MLFLSALLKECALLDRNQSVEKHREHAIGIHGDFGDGLGNEARHDGTQKSGPRGV